jgi:phage terminase large subunit-like protein
VKYDYPKTKQARHAIEFAESLTLVDDDLGKPVKLVPFQKFILGTLFGRVDKKGQRLVNRACLFIPRKNSKTFLCAVCVILWLIGLGKRGAQILSIANSREQAAYLFKQCKEIIEHLPPEIRSLFEIVETTKRITVPSRYNFYAALSGEAKTKTAWAPSLVIIDEAHDITDPELIKNLTTGFGARTDYLCLFVGTGGTRKDTPFYAEYEYAKKIKEGKEKNDKYAAFIWEAPEDADIFSEETWRTTMPAWDHFANKEFFRSEFDLAKQMPHKEVDCRQHYLNQWQIGGGISWIKDIIWMSNTASPAGDAEFYTAGADLASVLDTSSLLLFGKNRQGKYDVIPFIWCCEEQIKERRTAEFDYKRWADAGLLRVTPGNAQDQDIIFGDLLDIFKRYKITKIAIDRYGTQWFGPRLTAQGLPAAEFGQSYADMTAPLKRIETMVRNKELAHGGHPILQWMCSNTKLQMDSSDNYRIVKRGRDFQCDGMVALAMAVGVYPFVDTTPAIYHNRDLLMSLLPKNRQKQAAQA